MPFRSHEYFAWVSFLVCYSKRAIDFDLPEVYFH